jgi:chromosome segregation ATPase
MNATTIVISESSNSKPASSYDPNHPITSNHSIQKEGSSTSYIILPNMATQAAPPRKSSRAHALHIDITQPKDDDEIDHPVPVINQQPPPKSPGLVLQNFFGWKSKDNESSSSHGSSPAVSPGYNKTATPLAPAPVLKHAKTMPTALDIPKANSSAFSIFGNTLGISLPTPPASSTQVADLENELREISTELANSIKREMELEDEVERLRMLTADQHTDGGRRTSDYYSDSGASSVRYGPGEEAIRIEELEKSRRKAELEKAQVKLDMSGRMAEVLKQRRLAEDRVQLLEEHVQTHSRSLSPLIPDSDRVRQLEGIIEEMKRKLDEERRSRDNMEELIGGMRHEIQQYKGERDNLKDEVVPQLESKLASLEMFVSEGTYFPPPERGVDPILEDGVSPLPQSNSGLSRSKSSAGRWAAGSRVSRSNSLAGNGQRSRSGSIGLANESREQLIERAKDLEAHREALHKALKQLLERHRWQEKQYTRKIKLLDQDRRKPVSSTPRRSAFHTEVKNLRDEIHELRNRADDALDQKWQTEKGLSGLKMDLDRAREETSSLRTLLREHDISIPNSPIQRAATQISTEPQQESLDKVYAELRTTHALSIAHLKDLGSPQRRSFGPSIESNTILTLLKKSLSAAESERDTAHSAAEKYRNQARQLQQSELTYLSKQADLSTELFAAAGRMDDLSGQVRDQLSANGALRKRLTKAIERGDREQHASEERVRELQGKLRALEDRLVRAQQASDDAMAAHDDDARRLREADNSQLQRHRSVSVAANNRFAMSSGASSGAAGLGSPLLFAIKSPRLDVTSSGVQRTLPQTTGRAQLEARVKELEKALTEAESEMGEVVGRMNRAQIEVAELQSER